MSETRLLDKLGSRILPSPSRFSCPLEKPTFWVRVWQHVQLLLMGAILAPGKGTVSTALRAVGLGV